MQYQTQDIDQYHYFMMIAI